MTSLAYILTGSPGMEQASDRCVVSSFFRICGNEQQTHRESVPGVGGCQGYPPPSLPVAVATGLDRPTQITQKLCVFDPSRPAH